jgi:hypothetical protein
VRPLKNHWLLACTVCVPAGTEIVIVSLADGPLNVKSFCAACAPSIVTDSCAVATSASKFWYEKCTCVHEMSIVLVCADAAPENAIIPSALSSKGPPTPIPAIAVRR